MTPAIVQSAATPPTRHSAAVRRLVIPVLRAIVVAWIALFALVGVFQRKLLFIPLTGPEPPSAFGLHELEVKTLRTPDGETLTLWTKDAAPGKPTILYFHGNAGWLIGRQAHFRKIIDEGWGLYAISYRSYGGSTGTVSEEALIADGLLAFDSLLKLIGSERRVVIYGESLGAGIAVQVAAKRNPGALVLESPFSSALDVAGHRYWYLPVELAMKDPFLSTAHAPNITAPTLVLAGTKDAIIPVQFSRKLVSYLPSGTRYVEYREGGHVDLIHYGGFEEMRSWIRSHIENQSARP